VIVRAEGAEGTCSEKAGDKPATCPARELIYAFIGEKANLKAQVRMGKRCFVGIPLPESYQEGLARIVEQWRGELASEINWTKRGNWHLTLYFLGEIDDGTLTVVRNALAGVERERFVLQAGGGGFFPPGKPPRVIWAGLRQGSEASSSLAEDVEKALVNVGLPGRDKPFAAHLTLGRVKKGARDDWKGLLRFLQAAGWPEIEVDSFVLWQSNLTPEGPVYSEIERYPLR
jgi:2'-5' RNA ligase